MRQNGKKQRRTNAYCHMNCKWCSGDIRERVKMLRICRMRICWLFIVTCVHIHMLWLILHILSLKCITIIFHANIILFCMFGCCCFFSSFLSLYIVARFRWAFVRCLSLDGVLCLCQFCLAFFLRLCYFFQFNQSLSFVANNCNLTPSNAPLQQFIFGLLCVSIQF